jgi:hypothetical protein
MDRSLATAIQLMEEETVESPEQNPRLRMMARWFFLTFWAIIATGAIRKWLFPSVKVLYLLQDVPILLAYGYALITGFFTRTYMLLGLGLMAVLILLQGLAQIVFGQLPIFVALVGFHNYLFYFPMLLIFPLCLTEKYRKDLVRWNLLLSLPMCLLALAQALSPKGAWVNKTSEGDAFGVPGADIARVSGTFNFIAFYGIWAGMAVAMCVGEWLLPKHRRVFKNTWLLILCTFTVNLCHLVSGSRSAIALAASSIVGAMVAAVVLGSNRAILAIGGICMFLRGRQQEPAIRIVVRFSDCAKVQHVGSGNRYGRGCRARWKCRYLYVHLQSVGRGHDPGGDGVGNAGGPDLRSWPNCVYLRHDLAGNQHHALRFVSSRASTGVHLFCPNVYRRPNPSRNHDVYASDGWLCIHFGGILLPRQYRPGF